MSTEPMPLDYQTCLEWDETTDLLLTLRPDLAKHLRTIELLVRDDKPIPRYLDPTMELLSLLQTMPLTASLH